MSFGPEYPKIQTLWRRDERKVVIPGDFTMPELRYLADLPWRWTEKVDGTNIRLHWDGSTVTIGGRTDNAQLPPKFAEAIEAHVAPALWAKAFPDADDVTVYGEGYGAGIQKGGSYRPDKGFIAFDVKVSEWWLRDEDMRDVAQSLGLDVVPSFGWGPTLNDVWQTVVDGDLKSDWPEVQIEGLVGKPGADLFNRRGERIAVKVKVRDWTEYLRKTADQPTREVGSPA